MTARPSGKARWVAGRTGYAGLPEDGDNRNRRADYVVTTTANTEHETFAFAAADLARADGPAEDPGAPRRAWGDQTERTTWIDFHGPSGTVPRVSTLDVLSGGVPAGTFRDQLVVVGLTTRNSTDVHRTPLDGGRPLPGPEVQAAAFQTMLRDGPLRDPPRVVDLLAVLTLATLPAVAGLMGARGGGHRARSAGRIPGRRAARLRGRLGPSGRRPCRHADPGDPRRACHSGVGADSVAAEGTDGSSSPRQCRTRMIRKGKGADARPPAASAP